MDGKEKEGIGSINKDMSLCVCHCVCHCVCVCVCVCVKDLRPGAIKESARRISSELELSRVLNEYSNDSIDKCVTTAV